MSTALDTVATLSHIYLPIHIQRVSRHESYDYWNVNDRTLRYLVRALEAWLAFFQGDWELFEARRGG